MKLWSPVRAWRYMSLQPGGAFGSKNLITGKGDRTWRGSPWHWRNRALWRDELRSWWLGGLRPEHRPKRRDDTTEVF